ncbi:MAG: hypothetical protein L6R40_005264 [Gallowayella cf. fulva]|nr:MAG: hypothetical protein L6R40_005264 [Xanthomendoza cf. fulva]
MVRKNLPFVRVFFLYLPVLCSAAPSGSLNVYLDFSCMRPSVLNPKVSVPLNTCLVSPNAYGMAVQVLPACATGTASLDMYWDTACGSNIDVPDFQVEDNCYADDSGQHIRAVQFVCKSVAGGSAATSTTTLTFGSSLIPIASGAPSSGETQSKSPSSNNAQSTSSPDSKSNPSSTSGSTSSSSSPAPSPTKPAVDDDGSGSGSGLSRSAVVGLGVGVPIATLIVALLAWLFPVKKLRQRRKENNIASHQASMSNPMYGPTNPIHELPIGRGLHPTPSPYNPKGRYA